MDVAAKLLMNYYGRDRVIRTVSYVAMLGAGRAAPPLATKLGTVAARLGAARTTLRLFDDVLMYKHLTGYGWGKHVSCVLFMHTLIYIYILYIYIYI